MHKIVNGFLSEVSIILIDKTNPSDPLEKKTVLETHLKVLLPYGLNISESAVTRPYLL